MITHKLPYCLSRFKGNRSLKLEIPDLFFIQSCKLVAFQEDSVTRAQYCWFLCSANPAWLSSDVVQALSVNAEGLEFSAKYQAVCKAFLL